MSPLIPEGQVGDGTDRLSFLTSAQLGHTQSCQERKMAMYLDLGARLMDERKSQYGKELCLFQRSVH